MVTECEGFRLVRSYFQTPDAGVRNPRMSGLGVHAQVGNWGRSGVAV
jgi:hypothetical protein